MSQYCNDLVWIIIDVSLKRWSLCVDGFIYRENFDMRSAVENQIKNSDLELFDRSVSGWSELPQQDFDIYRWLGLPDLESAQSAECKIDGQPASRGGRQSRQAAFCAPALDMTHAKPGPITVNSALPGCGRDIIPNSVSYSTQLNSHLTTIIIWQLSQPTLVNPSLWYHTTL